VKWAFDDLYLAKKYLAIGLDNKHLHGQALGAEGKKKWNIDN
jgi:hypothetical protein